MGVAEDIVNQYPFLSFLVNDPEIGPLLTEAVSPGTEFSPERFQAKFMQTNWYRSQSQYGREQQILAHTDPGTYWSNMYEYQSELSALSDQLGRRLSPEEALWLATVGQNMGVSPDSAYMRHQLAGLLRPEEVIQGKGAAGVAKNDVENLIKGEWFAPLDYQWLATAGINIASGQDTLESFNARLASQAWHMYPHLRTQISEGQTMADIFRPYRALIAEELELGSAENVSMNNSEWSQLTQWRDPKTGEMRLPTISEVTTLARSKPQWWNTARGRQSDAAATQTMLQMFGKVK